MNDRTQQPYWAFLYGAFLTQTDPAKLKALLEPLEAAMVERMQELADVPEVQKERPALQTATRRLLKIKITRLDFPPVSGAGMRQQSPPHRVTHATIRRVGRIGASRLCLA